MLQGLDVPDLTHIILYGVPQTIIDLRQRKGQMGHMPGINALCLIIAEAWACSALMAEKHAEHKHEREMDRACYYPLCDL